MADVAIKAATTMEVSNGEPRSNAEAKKLLREERQREAKIEEQLAKALSGMTVEEKYTAVYKRLVESEKENRRLQALHKQYDRTLDASKRERENLILEHDKMVMTKTKLEALCRELQRQNKTIKDDSLAQIQLEEDRRKETQEKFQQSLNEIQQVMNENNEKNMKLKEDNMEMAKKFKVILEQYEKRDQQMEKMNKQMELVTQLSDAKLAKMTMESNTQKEQFLAEKQIMLLELQSTKKQLLELQAVEGHLRSQLNMYSDRYGEFQDSLKKSRSIYEGYQDDMKKMSKKMKLLEKETMAWKSRWETSNATVQKMLDDQIAREKQMTKTTRQLSQLQKLCRTLQAERATYLAALKEANLPLPAATDGDIVEEKPDETADSATVEPPAKDSEVNGHEVAPSESKPSVQEEKPDVAGAVET
ncbi:alpha-taxilin-like isoform X1 [Anopheles albimanus]|uniref:alpha-taxilin-like isoform X1 n=1 Tax=Anopheles albimanus TaxID=7167 RepID=UPI00163F3C82|nr:alpha-taxilin-like isoform X1 [Anopheles albimanus]